MQAVYTVAQDTFETWQDTKTMDEIFADRYRAMRIDIEGADSTLDYIGKELGWISE
jgi:hypothetical protein